MNQPTLFHCESTSAFDERSIGSCYRNPPAQSSRSLQVSRLLLNFFRIMFSVGDARGKTRIRRTRVSHIEWFTAKRSTIYDLILSLARLVRRRHLRLLSKFLSTASARGRRATMKRTIRLVFSTSTVTSRCAIREPTSGSMRRWARPSTATTPSRRWAARRLECAFSTGRSICSNRIPFS